MLEQGGIIEITPGHPYLSGNFAPIDRTRPLTPCAHTGTIPADLAGGQYVRNGGNPVTNGDLGRDAHWFDGDGMLSGVLFRRVRSSSSSTEKGQRQQQDTIRPEFVNQYLVTDVFALARTSRSLRKPVLPSIATLVNPATSVLLIVLTVLRTILYVFLSRLPGPHRALKKISVANTAVVYHDGRALATCESGPPLRFALPGLQTIGWFDGRRAENEPPVGSVRGKGKRGGAGFGGTGPLAFMREWTTAHPRVDPVTGELLAFHAVFVRPFVYYSIVPPTTSSSAAVPVGKTRRARAPRAARFNVPVPGVPGPKMMHDFGVSRTHTVILDLPLSLDPLNLARGVPVLAYDTAGRSRFGVFPRYEPSKIQWFETNPCCIFHVANCWDTTTTVSSDGDGDGTEGSEADVVAVNMLACRLTSASLVFSAGNLPTPAVRPVPPEYAEEEQCRLYYYSFPLSPAGAPQLNIRHQWALAAISFEFPVVSPLRAMRDARYVYGCSTRSASYTVALGKAAKIDFLAKLDVTTLIRRGLRKPPQPVKGCVDGRTVGEILASQDPDDPIRLFEMPPGWYAQEPRFVPSKDAQSEDDGWLLTYVFDEGQLDANGECPAGAASELWVIDARNMTDVVARVKLPQRVPYGLHGTWFSEGEIERQRCWEGVREVPREGTAWGLRDRVERWVG